MTTTQKLKPLPQADVLGHRTRFSDSSFYDEVCELCGTTDGHGGRLNSACPNARPDTMEEMAHYLRSHADSKYIETPAAAKALLRYGSDRIDELAAKIEKLEADRGNLHATLVAKVEPQVTINVESRRPIPPSIPVTLAEIVGDVPPSRETLDGLKAQGYAQHFANEQQRTLDKKDADDFGVPLEIVVKARQSYEAEASRTRLYFMAEWNSAARFRRREYVRRILSAAK